MKIREALLTMAPSLALQRAAADEIARLDARLEDVFEAPLCDVHAVVLREGQLYRFVKVDDCTKCAEMSKASFEAYGEPPA